MCRVRLFLRINCSGQMEHCKKCQRDNMRGVKSTLVKRLCKLGLAPCVLLCDRGEGLHLVGHVSGVRDNVQPQLFLPAKCGRAGNTGVLL